MFEDKKVSIVFGDGPPIRCTAFGMGEPWTDTVVLKIDDDNDPRAVQGLPAKILHLRQA